MIGYPLLCVPVSPHCVYVYVYVYVFVRWFVVAAGVVFLRRFTSRRFAGVRRWFLGWSGRWFPRTMRHRRRPPAAGKTRTTPGTTSQRWRECTPQRCTPKRPPAPRYRPSTPSLRCPPGPLPGRSTGPPPQNSRPPAPWTAAGAVSWPVDGGSTLRCRHRRCRFCRRRRTSSSASSRDSKASASPCLRDRVLGTVRPGTCCRGPRGCKTRRSSTPRTAAESTTTTILTW
mmetsp:Transcript_22134/g.48161  ORF Transcript_22134/g.48161 Transcript_22134/m.48161 type:complete len:229 (+) Transcript_22134:358-1044(+)